MKKIVLFGLLTACVLVFCSCGRETEDDGKALLTADSTINVTSNAGVITLNEDVATVMLGVFLPEDLGLNDEISSYELKLGETTIFGKSGCLVEAYGDNKEKPEGIFAIVGQECYVFSNNQYMLLTLDGPVEVTTMPVVENQQPEASGDVVDNNIASQPVTEIVTNANGETEIQIQQPVVTQPVTPMNPGFKYSAENDKVFKQKFSVYSQEELGVNKDINEFILDTSGVTTIAEDGEKVYIINVFEKDGTKTEFKLAFSEKGNYKFNTEINKFQKLK